MVIRQKEGIKIHQCSLMDSRKEDRFFWKNRKAQVTIFIVLAIIIVAVVSLFFIFKDQIFQTVTGAERVPAVFEPLHNNFLSCLEETTKTGLNILGSQGGYIYPPDFESGSNFMPFSSQLDFLGTPVPYWYYVSGNNIKKEQVPSKTEMEEQLAKFVEERIGFCSLRNYLDQGFIIGEGTPNAKVIINLKSVSVSLEMPMNVSYADQSVLIRNHEAVIDSRIGKLYESAKKIYDYEQEKMFLENYAVDTLRLYAPVDGVEITCSPKVWDAQNVFSDLQKAIEANTLAIKMKGGDYDLKSKDEKYFVTDLSIDENVQFLTSKNWPYSFEVNPSQGSVLIAKPVGNQQGLGILGFCYVPYHFVYDLKYPVMVQLMSGEEVFQFPFAVVVQGNKPRVALNVSSSTFDLPELCNYMDNPIEVHTYDYSFNPVDADISFECFTTQCDIGKTDFGYMKANFPQCVNGFVIARADGFEDARQMFSTTEEGSVDVFMNKLYNETINLKLDGSDYNGEAIINFVSDVSSKTISYPNQKNVELGEGQYEIQVYIYKQASLQLAATKTSQCVEVSQEGVMGVFGATKEKCFDIEIPAQIISNALAGGGKQEYYILESTLSTSSNIEIGAQSLSTPNSIEQLEINYELFETKNLDITFN